MDVGKKNIIIAVVLCISITVIGISFAYFTSNVSIGGSGSSISGTTGDMINVAFDAGSALNLENVNPGAIATKDFTVTVTPTENENTVTYAIVLDITANTFEKCTSDNQTENNNCVLDANEITYQLTNQEGSQVASGDLTGQTGKITLLTETKTVSAATTYDYTLEINYVETGSDQNHNANKTLTSTLNVEFAETD